MEWSHTKSIHLFSPIIFLIGTSLLLVTLSPFSSYTTSALPLDDYDLQQSERTGHHGLQEILDELEHQGGLTGRIVPRSGGQYYIPAHSMARKSQRSNALRLRFGKRIPSSSSSVMGEVPITGTWQSDGGED